jgi:hypothetical protein
VAAPISASSTCWCATNTVERYRRGMGELLGEKVKGVLVLLDKREEIYKEEVE